MRFYYRVFNKQEVHAWTRAHLYICTCHENAVIYPNIVNTIMLVVSEVRSRFKLKKKIECVSPDFIA